MANDIANQICDAVDLLIGDRVSSLQFDKTVRATVLSVEDQSIGKYRVRYQNNVFYAYSNPEQSYRPKTEVYVEIPSSDYNKDKMIIGSVKKIGTQYLMAVSAQGRMTKIGTNVLTSVGGVNFCSYRNEPGIPLLNNQVVVNNDDLSMYKTNALYFMLGMTVQTNLPTEQQVGGGNYGVKLQVDYYTSAERQSLGNSRSVVTRTYVLDVNNMLGQPYKYFLPEKQYAIFEIDGKNLKGIKSISAFCTGFPKQESGHPEDIFLSNFQISFMQALSEQELSTSSLKILTPYGSYFTSLNDDTKYLEAELKLKGKKVNFNEQKVDFYWFIKDTGIVSSNQLYYSKYAGEGWRCLNKAQTYGGLTQFVPQGYRKHITIDLTPAEINTFKCVAVYDDTTLSATIQIQNKVAKTSIEIKSSAGTKFYFDTGKTVLTCNVKTDQTNLRYIWGYRTADGKFVSLTDTTKAINVKIQTSTSFVTYECTVYSGSTKRLGSAQITLTNGISENEYMLVINNGSQIFKYDEYGVSPASTAAAPEDRIIIPTLSFDIYNDLGQLVTPVEDAEKIRLCEIRWIWPDEDYTMLQPSGFELQDELIVNPTTNGNVLRRVLANSATLTFGIKNRFDIDAIDNNIRLEVSFQGHNLVTSTNFTFTKDGELGTNGTQYVSRLIPINNSFKRVYLQNGRVYGWNQTVSKKYNPVSGKNDITDKFVFTEITSKRPLKSQLWDGAATALYDSQTNTSSINARLTWDIVDVGARTTHNATVASDGTIAPGTNYYNVSTVVKTTLQSNELSELSRYYYATYPLDISKTPRITTHAIVTGGFNECMYNSDGTRSSFSTKPFIVRIFNQNGIEQPLNEANLTWTVSWYDNTKNQKLKGKNNVKIDPPSFFDSTTTNNYIRIDYSDANGPYIIILSIHLYLNRYGLAAMNDWDGTSIKLNNSGNQYILAPQIGAGKKQTDNTFTGMTMGKSFNVDGNTTNPEIGLMGFHKGIRSIFLDAQNGKAVFGKPNSKGQIVISPQKYGVAPQGAIYSANFYKRYDTSGRPSQEWTDADIEASREDKGMLIDLATPSIRFGNKNFSVNQDGHLTARGGGSIAGWQIKDNYLRSVDKRTILYAYDGPQYKVSEGVFIQQRFNIGTGKFVIYGDGTFKAANNKFSVTQDGTINSVAGHIGGWNISQTTLSSATNNITLNATYGTIYSNNKDKIDNQKDGFYIGSDGISLGKGKENFSVTSFGDLTSTRGTIGGWEITEHSLSSKENNTYFRDSGEIGHDNKWGISSDGDAFFNNITCKSTWDFGNDGGNHWTNDGFNFGSGDNLFSTGGFNFGGDWGSIFNNSFGSGFGFAGSGFFMGNSDSNYGGWIPKSDYSGIQNSTGMIWMNHDGSINTPNFSCGGAGIAVSGAIGLDSQSFTAEDVAAWKASAGQRTGTCQITIDGQTYQGTFTIS